MRKLLGVLVFSLMFLTGCQILTTNSSNLPDDLPVGTGESPIVFTQISLSGVAELNDVDTYSFGSGIDQDKSPVEMTGTWAEYPESAQIGDGIVVYSHRKNQPPFALVDKTRPDFPTFQNIESVMEISNNSGNSAFLLSFRDSPFSGQNLAEKYDREFAIYWSGSLIPVLRLGWYIQEAALDKPWNNNLWKIELNTGKTEGVNEYFLTKNGEKVYHFFSSPSAQAEVYSLQIDSAGWRLNYQEAIEDENGYVTRIPAFVHNGEDVLKKYGWNQAFGLNIFRGQIFFFFEQKDGKIGYWRNGKVYLTDFEEIWEYGGGSFSGVWFFEEVFRFYGKKGGFWYEFEGASQLRN